jgi:uncharacterized protein
MKVDLTPTVAMQHNARRGLQLMDDGRAGSGLVPQTVRDAHLMADGKALSETKVRKMPAWFARHQGDWQPGQDDQPGKETPGYTAWLLWGGSEGMKWAEQRVKELDAQRALDPSMEMVEPDEGTVTDAVVDVADCIEELSEALADTVVFKARAHGAHWNVKGPAFGAYHELFGEIYEDAAEAVDPLAEELLKLDVDAPSTLDEFAQRSTIKPEALTSDDPQVLATDLRDMNDMVLESLEDAYECAQEMCELAGLANLLAERIDMHRKWRWQLTRSISNAAEPKVEVPMNPPEDTEVEEDEAGTVEVYGRGLKVIGEAELRGTPSLMDELRIGAETVIEQRSVPTTVEVRSNADGTWQLEGLAAVFDSPSQDLGGFVEVLKRGSFKNVLRDTALDVRGLINHDPNLLLGRTTNGTMRLEETPRGLKYTIDVPDTSYGRDLRVLLERGDLTQSSFAFRVGKDDQAWTENPDTGGLVRTITNVTALLDCSVVTYPAYPEATAGVAGQTSSRASEQGTPANGAEQGEQADVKARRVEMERAQRERELRLREFLLRR